MGDSVLPISTLALLGINLGARLAPELHLTKTTLAPK